MENRRLALFFVLSMVVVVVHTLVTSWLRPPQEQAPQPAVAEGDLDPGDAQPLDGEAPDDEAPDDAAPNDAAPDDAAPNDAEGQPPADPSVSPKPDSEAPLKVGEKQPEAALAAGKPDTETKPEVVLTMGSADPDDPYRMLVTLGSRGAAVQWIELNSDRYLDLEDKNGYLGQLATAVPEGAGGCQVGVVGTGTPAARAGLETGDIITRFDGEKINHPLALEAAFLRTKPNEEVEIGVLRDGAPKTLTATLGRRPLALVHPDPETGSKPSFLLTLEEIDGESIVEGDDEIKGLDLLGGNWKVLAHSDSHVRFSRLLPKYEIEIVKEFRLEQLVEDGSIPGYGLSLEIEIYNRSATSGPREVAYRLDGPTGLPTEGDWYANKIGRAWGTVGMRDVVFESWDNGRFIPTMISCSDLGEDEERSVHKQEQVGNVAYAGVDAQYFSSVMIPEKEEPNEDWFQAVYSLRIGQAPKKKDRKKTNTSCRLVSTVHSIRPGGDPFVERYTIFAGPKKPDLLAKYGPKPLGLGQLVYYGWFGWVSQPMLSILHFFYSIIGNYGLAIILLTVMVRSCMFPLSRKQTLNAQKMQELQPEIKKLTEKYKKNMEQRSKAQQELFRKHNYNPLGGCWVMFIQLPIFIGLYRSLSVDVELRQAPLIWQGFGWCENLASPDMLFDWSATVPAFVQGWLGPFFNILPLVTVGLFLLQQKMFMPPATDEQTMMTQRMMKFMMLFMGVIFFRVASGLCIYFIASSSWGLAERKLLPKAKPPEGAAGTGTPVGKPTKGLPSTSNKNGSGQKRIATNGAPDGGKKKKQQRQKRR